MYISGNSKPKIVKKEVSKNTFRDFFIVNCSKCKRRYEHEITFKVTCPYCSEVINSTKLVDKVKD